MADNSNLFGDLIPGAPGPAGGDQPAPAGGLFDDLVPKASAPAQAQPTPEQVPTLRPGTGGTPPPVEYQPVPKAGYYPGFRGVGKVYTDPSSTTSIMARAAGEGLAGAITDIGNVVHPFRDTNQPAQLNPEDPLAKVLNQPMSQG
ncbi:MAG: hypothetical protein ACREQ5_32265, partial [Candidatus Dormibacteria bacterium]